MLNEVWRAGIAFVSPSGGRARLSILIFHRVLAQRDPFRPSEPTAEEFEQLMRLIRDQFQVLPLAEATVLLRERRLPARALAITFDDGYADNFTLAAPILTRLGLHATFFIATGYLDGGCMFNDAVINAVGGNRRPELDLGSIGLGVLPTVTNEDRLRAISQLLGRLKYLEPAERSGLANPDFRCAGVRPPRDLMMTSEQAAKLAVDFELGGHTVHHSILARIDTHRQRTEIVEGKRHVEELAGRPARLFAYPNGIPQQDYGREAIALVKEAGFSAALSTSAGCANAASDLFQLPRFTPWTTQPSRFSVLMLRNLALVKVGRSPHEDPVSPPDHGARR